jgi:hypothetical protein
MALKRNHSIVEEKVKCIKEATVADRLAVLITAITSQKSLKN